MKRTALSLAALLLALLCACAPRSTAPTLSTALETAGVELAFSGCAVTEQSTAYQTAETAAPAAGGKKYAPTAPFGAMHRRAPPFCAPAGPGRAVPAQKNLQTFHIPGGRGGVQKFARTYGKNWRFCRGGPS